MYKALYRKYRPLVFSDVVGQEHITTTLSHQVATGNISHAYLFTGSRGTGKTTCAKILSRAINCLNPKDGNPCDECENCRGILDENIPDVIEMDAASNNGVDNIRELRDRIAYAPQKAKYKVYIIDEVHMLSSAAANALLKTLEEPPAHAVFILATTEVNAILPTILSRCQRFDFHRIEPDVIAARLMYVAKCEALNLSEEAALLIANIADGGMRDALSLLDLAAANGTDITEDSINTICGRASSEYVFSIAEGILASDAPLALLTVQKLYENSVDMQRLCSEMCDFYRNVTLICAGLDPQSAVGSTNELAKKYAVFAKKCGIEFAIKCTESFCDAMSLMTNGNRRSVLEMAIIKLTSPLLDTSENAILTRIAALEKKLLGSVLTQVPSTNTAEVKKEAAQNEPLPKKAVTVNTAAKSTEVGKLRPMAEWNDILSATFKTAPLMFGLLSGSRGYLNGDTIIIRSESLQLRQMLNDRDGMNYKGLCEAILTVTGRALVPVMEKAAAVKKDDPLTGFMEKLNSL